MAYSFASLKSQVRKDIFPAGESSNLFVAHNKAFVEALVNIQRLADCWQIDNTQIIPHCATLYRCGLTVADAPRGIIRGLSVVDQKDAGKGAAAELGSETFSLAITDPASVLTDIAEVPGGGAVKVEVRAVNQNCEFYDPAAPQHYLVEIAYTDADGNSQTLTKQMFLRECDSSQSEEITVWEGSTIRATVTPVNEPFTDGGSVITVTVSSVATGDDTEDWCNEIAYDEVDFCHVQRYLGASKALGSCCSIPLWFGLPQALCGGKGVVPVPTNAGVPKGLPTLPLGYVYPQTSTDATRRAYRGVWAKERGKVFIAPWIQSTESILLKWDGIKREWADGDLVEPDPTLIRCVEMYLRWDHASKYDKNAKPQDIAIFREGYESALSELAYDCRQETMRRDPCQLAAGEAGSSARGSRISTLFYNDAQSYTASCPQDQIGESVTEVIPADTVGSQISKADANNKAKAQAKEQAEARLDCTAKPTTYYSAEAQYTATCEQEYGAPPPDGSPATVIIPAGQFTSTVNQAAADNAALAAAQAQARAQANCVFWNREQEYTAECAGGGGTPETVTIPAHTYSSPNSQTDADTQALNAARAQATQALIDGGTCPTSGIYLNSEVGTQRGGRCGYPHNCELLIAVTIAPGNFKSQTSQLDANNQALSWARQMAESYWQSYCAQGRCGTYTLNWP